MKADHHEPRVPDIILERYRLNELPQREADRLTDRLRDDAALRDRLDRLARSDDEMRGNGAAEQIEERVRRRVAGQDSPGGRRSRRLASWALPALAAAATIFIGVVARTPAPPREGTGASSATDGERAKGGLRPALALYRRTANGSETLADGAVARAGDLVRVGYRPAGRSYGVILSIDGRGAVTMHLPPAGDRAAALDRGTTALLDQAYELDDAPEWERFYFVTGDTAFPVAPVMEAARRAATDRPSTPLRAGRPPATLALPRGLEQSTFSLQKEAKP